jgi:hypothetical protein
MAKTSAQFEKHTCIRINMHYFLRKRSAKLLFVYKVNMFISHGQVISFMLYILHRKAYIYYVIWRKLEACKRQFIVIGGIQYYDRIFNIR